MALHLRTLLPAATLAVAASACGGSGHSVASPADRTVEVVMVDNAFEPTTLQVQAGETVRFSFRNTGAVVHEATIGDDAVQAAHHDEMSTSGSGSPADETSGQGAPEDDGHGDDGHGTDGAAVRSVSVAPGQTGELTHTFEEAGTLLIGCHEPGHWESGMKATISVG